MKKEVFKKIFIISLVFLFFPLGSEASRLYFDPEEKTVGHDSIFTVDLKIDAEECVNVIEAYVGFDNNEMSIVDFMTGSSIINLWIERVDEFNIEEVNREGKLYFAGGIPGGYCGKVPGDPGNSNMVARLFFKTGEIKERIESEKVTSIDILDGTRVLLNDGLGSEDELVFDASKITISSAEIPEDSAWRDVVNNDKISPEPFVIELHSNPDVYSGEYYIIFHTNDKQTGVDYYEVLEIRPKEKIGDKKIRSLLDYFKREKPSLVGWRRAETPYLLEDQKMKSTIKVRAVDKAGNERMVEYIPKASDLKKGNNQLFIIISIIIICLIALSSSAWPYIRAKNKRKEEEDKKEV